MSIDQFNWPPLKYRVDLLDDEFETEAFAREEDALRSSMLLKASMRHGGEWGLRARKLSEVLDPEGRTEPPNTLASYWRFREHRIPFIGKTLQLVDQYGVENVVRADVIKPGMARDLEGFMVEHPRRAMNETRTDLIRARPPNCDGFCIAAFHSEFDPMRQMFQGHAHLLVGGDYIPALERLRGAKAYSTTPFIRTPIRVTRELTNLPHALSYLLKGYIVSRPSLLLGANGSTKRPRDGQRLPEPYHSQYLMWLDQFQLPDLCLLMGVSARKEGFKISGYRL